MTDEYTPNTVVDMLHYAVNSRGAVDAFIHGDSQLDYQGFGACVAAMKQRLCSYSTHNQRIAIILPNSIELAISIFSVWKSNAQVVLFNPSYPLEELTPLLLDAAPSIIIAGREKAQELEHFANNQSITLFRFLTGTDDEGISSVSLSSLKKAPSALLDNTMPTPESLALLLYTGGTTGLSKGVIHSHATLMAAVKGMYQCWPTNSDEEVWLSVAPIFHIWGLLFSFLNPIFSRATNVMIHPFNTETTLTAISAHKVSIFGGGPPAFYQALLASPHFPAAGFSNLRICPGGGAAFSAELILRWKKKTGLNISEAFGMTEIAPICGYRGKPSKVGSVGPALPGMEIDIVALEERSTVLATGNIGEIRVRGPNAILGYRNRTEDTLNTLIEGWVYTGDIGYLDEDGFLFVTDRKKDMVNVSGFKVFPREIDELLYQHPLIDEACTTGIKDARTGEAVCVYIVLNKGAALNKAEVLAYMEPKLVNYKLPSHIFFVDAIAKTQANKPDRKALAALAESTIHN